MFGWVRGSGRRTATDDVEALAALRWRLRGASEPDAAVAVCATARDLFDAAGASLDLDRSRVGAVGATPRTGEHLAAPVHRGELRIGTLTVHRPRRHDGTARALLHLLADSFGELSRTTVPTTAPYLPLPTLLSGLRPGDLLVLVGSTAPTTPDASSLAPTEQVAVVDDGLAVRVTAARAPAHDEAQRILRGIPGAAAGVALHLPHVAPVETLDLARRMLTGAVARGEGVVFVAAPPPLIDLTGRSGQGVPATAA